MKSKLTQKIKTNLLSIIVAIAMMFSANFSSIFAMTNFARYASAKESIYYAKSEKTFDFKSSNNLTTTTEGISKNYYVSRNAEILDAYNHVVNKKYFPIAKFNGFTALKEEREALSADELKQDTADNYYGVISTNGYQVAHKEYTKVDGDNVFETVKVTTTDTENPDDPITKVEDKNVVYVTVNKKNNETDADYNNRRDNIQQVLNQINADKTISPASAKLYVLLDTTATNYDSQDYATISTDSDAYTEITKDFEGKTIGSGSETFNVSDYKYSNKKTFEYEENILSIRTSNSISLVSNGYYVVSVWVYTAGEDTTATLSVTGTNLNAKIENISTNGLWVQYYLFIETKSTDSTSININLYYGDDNGVTGLRSLQSYKDGQFPNSNEDNYQNITMTGTVAFDQLKIHQINQEEYTNQTINGFGKEDIAKANLANKYQQDITLIKNNKEATANTTGEGSSATTTYTYSEVGYNNISKLYSSASYSAKVDKPSFEYGDGSFQTLNDKTNADLIYNYNNSSELDFDTYKDNNGYMFNYYMPRYTTDTSNKHLTIAQKQAYRQQYNNSSLNSTLSADEIAKYGYSQLWASVVGEETQFKGYEKDKYDQLGNKVEIDGENDEKVTDTIKDVHNNTFVTTAGEKNYILKLENKSSYELGVTTSAIKVPANAYYRISVWAYSSSKDATATAKLFATLKERTTSELGTLLLTSTSVTDFEYNSNSTNGWKELSFVVKGNPHQDCNVYLSLIASENDTVYFDQITVENISSSSYSSGSNSLDLSSKAILTSNVTNGLFTNIKTDSADPILTYPYSANNGWTVDSKESDSNVINGIINTNKNTFENTKVPAYNEDGELDYYDQNYITFDGSNYRYTKDGANILLTQGDNYLVDQSGKFVKATTLKEMFHATTVPQTTINDILQGMGYPGYADADNETLPDSNVYAVYLPENTDDDDDPNFLLKSSNMSSFSSNSVYKLTFQVWIDTNFEGSLTAKLVYDSKTISDIVIDSTTISGTTRNKWHTLTFYIRTGNTSRSGISLQLGAENSHGTLFYQNVNYTALSEIKSGNKTTSVNEQFDNLVEKYPTISSRNKIDMGDLKYVRFIDLQSNNFTMHSTNKNDESKIYDSYSYTLSKKGDSDKYTQGTVGIINTDASNPAFKFNDADVVVAPDTNSVTDTALLLKNQSATDYTYVNSVFSNTLASKKYYKLTFSVKTSDMGDKGLTVIANGFTADDSSNKFENINTTGYTENNGWKQYTMYISVGSSSISSFSLSFKLGDTENSYTGWALISAINVEEIEEAVYEKDTQKDEIKNNDSVIIKQLKVEDSSDKDEDKDTESFAWSTFFLVFSSILLVVSLTVALVAVSLKRKSKKNTPEHSADGGIESNNDQEIGGIE